MTDDRLTIAALARLIPEMGRSAIQRYDDNPDVPRMLGKQGSTYPAESLPYWKHIATARAQDPPLVRPETAGIFLQSIIDDPAVIERRLSVIEQTEQLPAIVQKVTSDALELLGSLPRLETLLNERLPPPPDEWLTIEQVCARLQRSPSYVREHLKCARVEPGRYSLLLLSEWQRGRRKK